MWCFIGLADVVAAHNQQIDQQSKEQLWAEESESESEHPLDSDWDDDYDALFGDWSSDDEVHLEPHEMPFPVQTQPTPINEEPVAGPVMSKPIPSSAIPIPQPKPLPVQEAKPQVQKQEQLQAEVVVPTTAFAAAAAPAIQLPQPVAVQQPQPVVAPPQPQQPVATPATATTATAAPRAPVAPKQEEFSLRHLSLYQVQQMVMSHQLVKQAHHALKNIKQPGRVMMRAAFILAFLYGFGHLITFQRIVQIITLLTLTKGLISKVDEFIDSAARVV